MTILFILGFCIILGLALAGCLKLQVWDSGAHMINSDWMNDPEKFKLISRWGAQY